jgi:hypothetical protein
MANPHDASRTRPTKRASSSRPLWGLLCALCVNLLTTPAGAQPATPQSDSAYFRPVLFLGRTYVNDHSLILANGTWHLFYTKGDGSIRPWMSSGNEIEIGHETSTDLINWTTVPDALRIGPAGALDASHIYAPSVIAADGRYYLYYTGNEQGFFTGEHILLASSTDLMTWTRESSEPIFRPDSNWAAYYPVGYANGRGGPISFRDPFVLRDGDGYICYYVARLRDTVGGERACVAAATSSDLRTWTDRGPVLTRPVMGNDVNPYTHPESPCVVVRDGTYYLFWKGGSGTHYAMSDDPLDFETSEDRMLSTSHASKIFEWRGDWYITSCSRDINDVMHTQSDRTRGLFLAGIVWDGMHPRVTDLPATLDAPDEHRVLAPALFPNVVRVGERVRIASNGVDARVELVDVLGRRIDGARSNRIDPLTLSIETTDLRPGYYLVRVASDIVGHLIVVP